MTSVNKNHVSQGSEVWDDDELQRHTMEIKALIDRINEAAVEIGWHLIQVREMLPHGEFHPWAKTHFGWSPRKTRYLMQVARHPKSAKIADLPIDRSALYLLTAPTAPGAAMDEAIERASNGDRISPEIAKDMLAAHNHQFETSPYEADRIEDKLGSESHDEYHPLKAIDWRSIPPIINALYENGFIGEFVVDEISRQLNDVEEVRVRNVASRFGITDPELIPMLDRLCQQGSAVFDEIEASGCIEVSGESIRLPMANHRDLQRCFDESNYERTMAASQARKRSWMEELQKKLQCTQGENRPSIVITDELEGISDRDPESMIMLVPGPVAPKAIGNHLEHKGYRLLALIAYRGNPPVRTGNRILLANQARHYLLQPMGEMMETLCDVSDAGARES